MKSIVSATTVGLLLGLGLVAAVGSLAYRHVSSLDELASWVSHTHGVLETSQGMELAIGDAARARRSFAQTRDDDELEPYRTAIARVETARRELRALTADNPAQQHRLDAIDTVIVARIEQLDRAIRDARTHPFDAETEATFTTAGLVLTRRLGTLVGELDADLRRLLHEREAAMHEDSVSLQRTIVFGFSASIAIVFAAYLISRRAVRRRARSERDLADREQRLLRLVEAAPDAILIADGEGRIHTANYQAYTLFGYPPDALVGLAIEELVPEHERELHVAHRRSSTAAPAIRVMGTGLALFARRRDGTSCPVEVSLSPLETPEGRHVIAAVRDVTKRRELERFRDEYVGYVSHDLKNPLSVIALQAGLLGRLLEARGSADEQRAIRVIAESAVFIDHLVRELLEMAYIESEELVLHTEPVELGAFLTAVVDRTVASRDRSRVRLEIVATSTVTAETSRLERVIANLLQNAVKYAPAGSPICVRADVSGDRAVVSVIDHGPGLTAKECAFVFEKYKRTASARQKEGLGLGLYISRKIVEAHGGEIGVTSTPGHGATFFLRLPTVPAAVAVTAELRGVKILLVDDEANAVSALAAILDDEGLDVTSATTSEQALALAFERPPEIAVIDVELAGADGLMLLDELRARHPAMLAVIMSGHEANHAGIAKARQNGARYIGKPVDVEELLRTLGMMRATSRA